MFYVIIVVKQKLQKQHKTWRFILCQNLLQRALLFLHFFQDFPLSRFLFSANFYKRGNAKANGLSILELFSSSLLAIFTRSSLNELAKSDLLNSDKSLSKSASHRYMENDKFNWRKLQLNISSSVITKIESFNNPNRITTLSIDDSIISRG